MGDKCSVKRSVIGRHCRIGSNVKVRLFSLFRFEENLFILQLMIFFAVSFGTNMIVVFLCLVLYMHLETSIGFHILQIVNSVVMNHVTIGDGCSVQGSVVCSNVQLQERATLRDCQVSHSGTNYYTGQLDQFILTNM